MNRDIYQEPLVSRYTSREMQELFSERFKFTHWRKCWVALAEAQHELGLAAVTAEMVAELKANVDNINFEVAAAKEREIRHDVMAHVFAYGQQCPLAEPIIHLGATSQFVVCNTDLLIQKRALHLIKRALLTVIANLAEFCTRHKDLATLGFTHYQPAQPTTVGKRNTLYLQDLLMDLEYIEQLEGQIKARGAKGTVGTQATFIELFAGDHDKVRELDRLVAQKIGFDQVFAVTGQTYPRKLDMKTAETLAGIGASAHKFAVDLRLLSNLKVQEEPFERKQVGSSAMAYKRNPMRSERMTGLARKLMGLPANFAATAANQWFERTLDDSAIRRMDLAQAFLLTDAILKLYINITNDMVVYPKQVERHLKEELPFMATEKILMACVERGKSRQEMHEVIREHSVAAGLDVKNQGLRNNLLERLADDERVPFDLQELNGLIGNYQQFTGRAAEQTTEFLQEQVAPVLEQYRDLLGDIDATLSV
ncbi:adenylosuccinate lyase [Desulfobulbus propionicus DSM 2032]|uniref:Adenylosuccinate lyase n=1 Tax=Desulfobulbus propionicus (strain ATCC 33891 / DSM 2032 / VKM B-1956 / 1pr3) TaxID=577650 RepID=A0A7U3YM64_DESPD|nr:adenylosuccinate lyase [Desulfobulbus propionicus]ADW17930.1 adenylosuccinate lyase [Desulfobulbus propionicus DSM 2032]